MNCDEAFNALTDPDTDCGAELEAHLSGCPRCRQMREVLSPALSLFSPFDDDEAADSFARDHGDAPATIRKQFLTLEAVQIAKEAALALSSREKASAASRRWTMKRAAVQVTVAAASVAAAFAFFSPPTRQEPPKTQQSAAVTPVSNDQCIWKERLRTEHANREPSLVIASCAACHLSGPIQ